MTESEEKSSRSRRRRRASASTRQRRRLRLVGVLVASAGAVAAVVVVLVVFVFGGGTSDEDEIESLARRSIEVLPAGEWPSLYESFTSEFQQRCPLVEFVQAGEDSASALGDDLQFIRFKSVENVAIEDENARAEIVGEIGGQPDSEYKLRALFRKEGGDWRISPVADSEGCQAFGLPTS